MSEAEDMDPRFPYRLFNISLLYIGRVDEVRAGAQDLGSINLYTATAYPVHMATGLAEQLIVTQRGTLSTQCSGGVHATQEQRLEERPQKKQLWE